MTIRTHTFEQQNVGDTVTTAGSLFDVVTIPSGSAIVIDNAHAMHGTKSAKFSPASGGNPNLRDNVNTSAVSEVIYLWLDALPTADFYFWRALAGSTRVASVHVNSAGKLRLSETGSTTGVWTAAATVPLSQWVRVEVFAGVGTGTTDGKLSIGTYPGDSTTPIEAVYSSTTRNLGTSPITILERGKGSTDAYVTPFWIDSLQSNDAATGLPGPYSPPANQAPVVTPPAAQLKAAGTTATLTMTASDPEGQSISAYSWTATSWPAAATAPTLTNAATATATTSTLTVPGVYTFTPKATDSGGVQGTGQPATVYVYAADGSSAVRNKRASSWTGSVSDLNDVSDSTVNESPAGPANSVQVYDMDPIGPGDVVINPVRLKLKDAGSAACTCLIEVLSGASDAVVATRGPVTVTDGWVDTIVTLTTGENTAFTNHGQWSLRLTANQP